MKIPKSDLEIEKLGKHYNEKGEGVNKAPSFGSGSPDRQFDYNIPHSPCSCPSTYLTTPKGSQLFILFILQGESVIVALGVSEKQELSAGS